jgi:tetratricopeptide (TPR) repeat protein
MAKEGKKKRNKEGMNKEQINKKLSKFNTVSKKIGYLQSIEPKIKTTKPQTQKAYYETLGDLYLKKEDLESAAEYYHKAGIDDKARLIWGRLGDMHKAYHEEDKALKNYNKANAFEKEEELLRKKEVHSLENKFLLVLAIGSFLCSFIFLSGSVTGNTILDANFKTSNLIGGVLFIVSVVASFFYAERRK